MIAAVASVVLETMAAALSGAARRHRDIIEPYLIQCGYLQRTLRARAPVTSACFPSIFLSASSLATRRSSVVREAEARSDDSGTINIVGR